MDAYLKWLEQSVAARLAEVAPVVFVRAHLQWTADAARLEAISAAGCELTGRWLNARPARRDVTGNAAAGSLNTLLEFEQGQSALVSSELARSVEPQTQILIVGRHGTVRFDDFPEPEWLAQ